MDKISTVAIIEKSNGTSVIELVYLRLAWREGCALNSNNSMSWRNTLCKFYFCAHLYRAPDRIMYALVSGSNNVSLVGPSIKFIHL